VKTNPFEAGIQYCPKMHILDSKLGLSSVQWLSAFLDNWTGRRDQDHKISGGWTNILSGPLDRPAPRSLPYVQMSNRGEGIVQAPAGLDETRRIVKPVVQKAFEGASFSYQRPQNSGLLILFSVKQGEKPCPAGYALPYHPLFSTPF